MLYFDMVNQQGHVVPGQHVPLDDPIFLPAQCEWDVMIVCSVGCLPFREEV